MVTLQIYVVSNCTYHFEAKANFVSGSWVLDYGATHNVITKPHNLEEYTVNEEYPWVIVKPFPLLILVQFLYKHLILLSGFLTICAPSIKKNLISVPNFCQDKTIYHLLNFLILLQDLHTEKVQVQG